LWRSVPTPFRAEVRLLDLRITVETNDTALLTQLADARIAADGAADLSESDFLWRIVRDGEAPGGLEPVVALEEEPLHVVTMGSSLMVAADRERKELLAFIGGAISPGQFASLALPLFGRLTLGECNFVGPSVHREAADAIESQDVGHKDAER